MKHRDKLTAKQAAEHIGLKSTSRLYALVHKRLIPFHKRPGIGEISNVNRGGGLYFYEDELDRWLGEK